MPYFEACRRVLHSWTHPRVTMHKVGGGDFEFKVGKNITEDVWTKFCAEGSTEKTARKALDNVLKGKHVKWAEEVKVTPHRTWGEFFAMFGTDSPIY